MMQSNQQDSTWSLMASPAMGYVPGASARIGHFKPSQYSQLGTHPGLDHTGSAYNAAITRLHTPAGVTVQQTISQHHQRLWSDTSLSHNAGGLRLAADMVVQQPRHPLKLHNETRVLALQNRRRADGAIDTRFFVLNINTPIDVQCHDLCTAIRDAGHLAFEYSRYDATREQIEELISRNAVQVAAGGCYINAQSPAQHAFGIAKLVESEPIILNLHAHTDTPFPERLHYVSGLADPVHDGPLLHPVRPMMVPEWLLNRTHHREGIWFLFTDPMSDGLGGYVGGAENTPVSTGQRSSLLQRITVLPTSLGDINENSSLETVGNTIEQLRPTGLVPNNKGSTVDLSAKTVLLSNAHKIQEELWVGTQWKPISETNISWASRTELNMPTMTLAPAFASIASVWLDKGVLGALGAANTWLMPTRTVDMDNSSKMALRHCALTPLALHRYFLRLWALYIASCAAEVAGSSFEPKLSSHELAPCTLITSFSVWASALVAAQAEANAPIFVDAYSAPVGDDVLPVLRLMTAGALDNAGCAQHMWAPVPGAHLYYSSTDKATSISGHIASTQILAAIGWLEHISGAADQSREMLGLASCLAYRPDGVGVLGAQANQATMIAIPNADTRAMLLSPFSLNATSSGEVADMPVAFGQPLRTILECAVRSMTFCVTFGMAARLFIGATSLPAPQMVLMANAEKHSCGVVAGVSRLARAASAIRNKLDASLSCKSVLSVWPKNVKSIRTNLFDLNTCSRQLLVIGKKLNAAEAGAVPYCKWVVQPVNGLASGRHMSVKGSGLIGTEESVYAAAVEAGAVGFNTVIDRLTATVVNRLIDENPRRINTFKPSEDPVQHLVFQRQFMFKNVDSALKFFSTAAGRAQGIWYIDLSATTEDVGILGDDMWLPTYKTTLAQQDQLESVEVPLGSPASGDGMQGESSRPEPQASSLSVQPEDVTTVESVRSPSVDLSMLAKSFGNPPLAITNFNSKQHDPLIDSLIRLTQQPNQSHYIAALDKIAAGKTWAIPPDISSDPDALSWLSAAVPTLSAGCMMERPQLGAREVIAMVNEAVAINSKKYLDTPTIIGNPIEPRQAGTPAASGSPVAIGGAQSHPHSAEPAETVLELSVVGSI